MARGFELLAHQWLMDIRVHLDDLAELPAIIARVRVQQQPVRLATWSR